jgi:hypothetical protein
MIMSVSNLATLTPRKLLFRLLLRQAMLLGLLLPSQLARFFLALLELEATVSAQ